MKKHLLSHSDVFTAALELARMLPPDAVCYAVPRGGIPATYALQAVWGNVYPGRYPCWADRPEHATHFIDDLLDSGSTAAGFFQAFPGKTFCALFHKGERHLVKAPLAWAPTDAGDDWLVFPWEVSLQEEDFSATDAVTRMLEAIGEDPTREGLLDTPSRVVRAWGEWFRGYKEDVGDLFRTFEDGAEGCDEMVLLTDIPVQSHCEHHITPIIGVAHVGYIPNGKIVGISKIARVVDHYARRLQVQERLTNQIANCLVEHLNPLGVGVIIRAKHFCMGTRGVKMPNVDTTTSAMRGVFLTKPEARAEFVALTRPS